MSLSRCLARILLLALAVPCSLSAQAVRGSEIAVSPPAKGIHWAPAVGVAANGDFAVAFQKGFFLSGQETSRVWVRLYRADGTPKGRAFRVSNARASEGSPAVAVAPGGEVMVVWQSGHSLATSVWGRLFSAEGEPLGEKLRLSSRNRLSQRQPDVAALPDGGFVAVWDEAQAPFNQGEAVMTRRFSAEGKPLEGDVEVARRPQLAPEKALLEDFDEIEAKVAVAPNGSYYVTWLSYRGDAAFFDIYARQFAPDGSAWGEAFRVNDGPLVLTSQFDGKVAALDNGDSVVVWASNGAETANGEDPYLDGVGLFARRLSASGSPAGPSFKVNTFTPGRQERPAIAALPDGGFFVIWASEKSLADGSTIFLRRFAADASPRGEEVALPLSASAAKAYPAIGINSYGEGAVAWASFVEGGDAAVVVRRIAPRK